MKDSIYGDSLYLFHPDNRYNEHCVISAHGGYSAGCFGGSTFNLPVGVKLAFYSQHGSPVNDFGIGNFLSKIHRIVETQTSDDNPCFNYVLTKYQGRHSNNAETYDSIGDAVNRNRDITTSLNSIFESANEFNRKAKRRSESKELLLAEAITPLSDELQFEYPFDVVTVRNRYWRSVNDMTLKKVVKAVLDEHDYATIHCFFCRSIT